MRLLDCKSSKKEQNYTEHKCQSNQQRDKRNNRYDGRKHRKQQTRHEGGFVWSGSPALTTADRP